MSTAGTEKLGQLVQSFDRLEVEDYQRVYVWTPEDIDDLFRDLKSSLNAENERDHFFGTLILQTDPESGHRTAKVVDGQQRLTTTMLLVAAIRDAIIDLGIDTLPGQGSQLELNVANTAWDYLICQRDTSRHRFRPNRLLRKIMENSVMPKPLNQEDVPWGNKTSYDKPTALNKPFRRAIRYIRELIEKDLENFTTPIEKLNRTNSLLDTLLNRFTVLKVITNSIDESLEIFLTLNSRGQELKASDLARGEILKSLTSGLQNEQEIQAIHATNLTEWDDIGARVNDHEVFLRHFLVATGDKAITKKMILDTVQKRLRGDQADGFTEINRAMDFWNQIKKASIDYSEILRPTCAEKPKLYLELMDDLLMSHRVLFLNVVNRKLSPSDLEEITRLAFVLSFRWTLLGMNAQDLENLFRTLGKKFRDSSDVEALKSGLKSEAMALPDIPRKRWEKDKDTGAHGRSLLYMIYWTLTGNGNKWPRHEMHLEHIAPQGKTDTWVKELFGVDEIDEDDYSDAISSVGNLTLLDPKINVKIQNDPFTKKKIKYQESSINLVTDLLNFDEWSVEIIDQRTQWLAEMFEIIWSVEASQAKVTSFNEWLQHPSVEV
jgi:Protein of unknown function DUF262/Protein of unknown function (DUF1524)